VSRAARARWARLAWGVLALLALSLLVTSRILTPHPRGLGTHVALGLPPCGFLLAFGLPCPTCGLTTAFAQLARFELLASVRTHPLGLPLFALTLVSLPLALRNLMRAESPASALVRMRAERWALLLGVALLVTWCTRLAPLLTR